MEKEIMALEKALAEVRNRLMSADVTAPGFGEVRSMYNDLSDLLIRVAHKSDDEIAGRLDITVKEIAEEWESNKTLLGSWAKELKVVAERVGKVLKVAGLPNPLAGFLD